MALVIAQRLLCGENVLLVDWKIVFVLVTGMLCYMNHWRVVDAVNL
jgi:hypothetical protein